MWHIHNRRTELELKNGTLKIQHEGRIRKFVREVEQISFSGPHAASNLKNVLYVTERCVFQLTPDGPELIEVAPGIRLEEDILRHMDFVPRIRTIRPMPLPSSEPASP